MSKKYPRYRQVTPYNTPYTFERNVQYDVYLNLSSGWNARGAGCSLTWSLSNMLVTMGDGVVYGPTIPGSTELSTLFDQWRIDRVDAKFIFSANQQLVVSSAANTHVLPAINFVSDYDNNNPNEVLLEYPQCRTIQMSKPYTHTILRPGSITSTETTSGTNANGKLTRGAWQDCAVTTVPHYGIKFQYSQFDPVDIDYNPAIVVGALKIMCKIYYTLRNPR